MRRVYTGCVAFIVVGCAFFCYRYTLTDDSRDDIIAKHANNRLVYKSIVALDTHLNVTIYPLSIHKHARRERGS